MTTILQLDDVESLTYLGVKSWDGVNKQKENVCGEVRAEADLRIQYFISIIEGRG